VRGLGEAMRNRAAVVEPHAYPSNRL